MTADARAMLPAALLAAAEHDVRGLLNTLQLGAETLTAHLDGEPLGAAAATLGRATERLSRTLGELVDTAGQLVDGEVTDEVVDLGELVRDVTAQFAVGQVRSPAIGRLLVGGSSVILRHLLTNLVDNAVVAAGAPQVSVRVRSSPNGRASVVVRNPTARETAVTSTDGPVQLMHTRSGRGLSIVRVLAEAARVEHTHEVVDGVYVARLSVPGRIDHPSLLRSTNGSPHHEAVIAMDAFRRTAAGDGPRER